MAIRGSQLTRQSILADDPLCEFHVWWDDVSIASIKRFERCLSSARTERPLQRHFTREPLLLIQHLGGGHGRWVIPHKRLGSERTTDFVIGERSSVGFEWCAVELESPRHRLFTKSGDPTKALVHALRQVADWRTWLTRNQEYAARSRNKNGLGLTDIRPDLPALVLIGRRVDLDAKTHELRRQMEADQNVRIHTYDFVLDAARGRVRARRKRRRKRRARGPA